MRRAGRFLLVTMLSAGGPGCAGGGAGGGSEEPNGPTTSVEVQNHSMHDVAVYVLHGGADRLRLGLAVAHETTLLRIPADVLHGVALLRFVLDPIGSGARPLDEEILVRPGDRVRLNIPSLEGIHRRP